MFGDTKWVVRSHTIEKEQTMFGDTKWVVRSHTIEEEQTMQCPKKQQDK
jgi:hypothetical protein